MPEYRRAFVPGGTFFFTIVTYRRRPIFAETDNVERLRAAVREVMSERPFEVVAGVVLPDHLHFIWTLPPGDSDYSWRIGRMKVLFTRSLRADGVVGSAHHTSVGGAHPTVSRAKHREADVWQRRFWEHVIRDERDLEHHFDYVHYNPVKHGLAKCPHAWPHSSFGQCVERRIYEHDWCCTCTGGNVQRPYPEELDQLVGE